MIVMPRRSVTRFFIPLIDVLTLLFCIFLLMPLFREEASRPPADETSESPRDLALENAALEKELQRRTEELKRLRTRYEPQIEREQLTKDIERLRKEKIQALQEHLFVRVLEIAPRTGELFYPDPNSSDKQGLKIDSAEAAERLIHRHQEEARGRDLYYVFLFPHEGAYPTVQQFEQYRRWFASVAFGVGNAR